MRKTFHLSEIESYSYCAARYYFEHKRNRGLESRITFDLKRKMFKEFFRVQELKRKDYNKLNRYVMEYQKSLFRKDQVLSPSLIAAYMQKSFEALWFSFSDKDVTVTTPAPIYLEIDSKYIVGIDVDAIFIERGTRKAYNKHKRGLSSINAITNIYFCILVPPEEWHPINLSNRFDAMLCKHYIYPDLKVSNRKSIMKIMYFCPENGRSLTIENSDIIWTTQDKSRMVDIMDRMSERKFHREPTHNKCYECPVKEDCTPRNIQDRKGTGGECYSVLLPPLLGS